MPPRSPPDPGPLVVSIVGPLARADIPVLCARVRAELETSGGGELVICDVGGIGSPDAVAIDALAHLQLTALRLGRRIRLKHASAELTELLKLTGLSNVLPHSTK